MDAHERLTEILEALEGDPSPERAERASELVEAMERVVQPGDPAARLAALSARVELLAALDRRLDPDWDPDLTPVRGVAPPPSALGPVRSSGEVDPETIADPVERAEYVRALRERRTYAEWWDAQHRLRGIVERGLGLAAHFLGERYAGPAEARRDLERALDGVTMGASLEGRLRAAVRGS